MSMMSRRSGLVAIVFLGLLAPAWAETLPLQAEMTAWKIQQKDGAEARIAVAEVVPGDVLEYEMIYRNAGQKPLSGVVVMGPVPDSTRFVAHSAKDLPGAALEVSLDDGKTWAREPLEREVTENGVKRRVAVPPTEYTAIRWVEAGALDPGVVKTYRYRVKVQ